MTPEQTRNAIKVMQAALDGKEIQVRHLPDSNRIHQVYTGPRDWETRTSPKWDWVNAEYRIKPETVKYRRYLFNAGTQDKPFIAVGIFHHRVESGRLRLEQGEWFIRWIDTEWQEVEI